jgi:hypothetical protein
MKTAWLTGFGLYLLLITTSAFAVKVDALYKATLPVTTQTSAEREQGVKLGISQVFIKISGNNQVIDNPKLKARLGTAETLVQQYSYSTPPIANNNAPYLLEIQFDAEGINQWLRDADVPIWGQNRPLIVAWITYTAPKHPIEIISSDTTNEITRSLKQLAIQRGLPLLLPLMDVTDLTQVSTNDVSSMAIANLSSAAKRYDNDAMLIGNIIQSADGFTSQWKLVFDDNQSDWTLTGKSMIDILPVLINNVTNTLATRFAVMTTDTVQKDLTLKVTGITQYPDFAKLTRYLNQLTPVANVEIVEITTTNEVILKISLRSSQESFIQTLEQGKKLTPVKTTNNDDTRVVYQWNP